MVERLKVEVYTDGSCKPSRGRGGWAALILANGLEEVLVGGEPATTNQRMELMAVIKALEALDQDCDISVYTDSEYVSLGITKWIERWRAKGWKTSRRKPPINEDLWKRLYELDQSLSVKWVWVRGHDGNELNERVHYLACEARWRHGKY